MSKAVAYLFSYKEDDPIPFYERTYPLEFRQQGLNFLREHKLNGFLTCGWLPKNFYM